MKSNSMAETFRAAAALIGTGGLCKKRLDDEDGRHCLMGALIAVTPDFYEAVDRRQAAMTIAEAVIREQFPDRAGSSCFRTWFFAVDFNNRQDTTADEVVVYFNNHQDTTADEVVAVLEKTAARLDERISAA